MSWNMHGDGSAFAAGRVLGYGVLEAQMAPAPSPRPSIAGGSSAPGASHAAEINCPRYAKLQRVTARCRVWSSRRKGVTAEREHIVVGLLENEKIVVAGASSMWVAFGSVETFGAKVSAPMGASPRPDSSTVDIHSLDWSGLVSIAPSRHSNAQKSYSSSTTMNTPETLTSSYWIDTALLDAIKEIYLENKGTSLAAICVFQEYPDAQRLTWSKRFSQWFGKARLKDFTEDPTLMPGFGLLVSPQGGRRQRLTKKRKKKKTTEDSGTTPGMSESVNAQQKIPPKSLAPLYVLRVPSLWKAVADLVVGSESVPTVLTCGGKNAGKSTFSRYLVNRLLSDRGCPVAFLETDVGQCEFTPPGLVSLNVLVPGSGELLGPSPTHLMTPILSFFAGDITPKTRPNLYMDSVHALLDEYRRLAPQYKEFGGMALVINTHGWVKGMGLDLMHAIATYAQPKHIVKFESHNPNRRFPTPFANLKSAPSSDHSHEDDLSTPSSADDSKCSEQLIHIMTPFAEAFSLHQKGKKSKDKGTSPSAAYLRTMRLIHYFIWDSLQESDYTGMQIDLEDSDSQTDDGSGTSLGDEDNNANIASNCNHGKKVNITKEHDDIQEDNRKTIMADIYAQSSSANADRLARALPMSVGWNQIWVNVIHCDIPPSEMVGALNGAIVAMCVWPNKGIPGSQEKSYLRETPLVSCLGLGIVRSIDVSAKKYFVLSPLPLEQLRTVNVFLRGNVQLPSEMLLSRSFSETPAYHVPPHLFISNLGTGATPMQAGLGQKSIVKRRRLQQKQ